MRTRLFRNGSYTVSFAKMERVGEEWNHIEWNIHHTDIQYHRLYLLRSGRARVSLYDRELTLVPGRVYFLPAFSIKESAVDEVMDKYYIHFQSSSPFFSLYRYLADGYSAPANPATEFLFQTVVENYAKGAMDSHFKVQGALDLILSDFVSDVTGDVSDIVRFDEVLKYIDHNYTKNISLSDLAAIMNISPMYFSNYFKRTFNISPKQYILNKRILESQRLLIESRMNVKEIALAVGFENENYFSEFFAKKVGTTALKFRKREIPTERETIF